MTSLNSSSSRPPLRILHLEDNPLIVFHVEQMIEDLGHVFAGSAASFVELKEIFDQLEVDGVLVDIDLKDGPTGIEAAKWLKARGVASIFVTGQESVAREAGDLPLAILTKPISDRELGTAVELFRA